MVTEKEHKLLRFISDELTEQGIPPSYREMSAYMGVVSPARPHEMVASLKRQKFVAVSPNHSRSIRITRRGRLLLGCCPTCGK